MDGDRVLFLRWGAKGEAVAEYCNGKVVAADVHSLRLVPARRTFHDPSGGSFTVRESEWAGFVAAVADLMAAASRGKLPPLKAGETSSWLTGNLSPEVAREPERLALALGQKSSWGPEGQVFISR